MAFTITYYILDKKKDKIKDGKIKVKNRDTEIGAKVYLEKYLRKKVLYFDRLVITECKQDLDFNDIFGGNSFGGRKNPLSGDNPFGKMFGGM